MDDHERAHRGLWRTIKAAFGAFALIYGAGYIVQGNQYANSSPALYVLRHVPGGMRTHGFILAIIGTALIYGAANMTYGKHMGVRAFCGYCVLTAFTMFGSWWITDSVQFSAPWVWLLMAVISGAMILFPPPPPKESIESV